MMPPRADTSPKPRLAGIYRSMGVVRCPNGEGSACSRCAVRFGGGSSCWRSPADMTIPTAALADEGGTPAATVTPHLGLDPDSPAVVTVAATGVPASTEMNVMECLPNNCFQLSNPTSAADGTLSIQVSVQWSYGPASTECNWDDAGAFCYVRVYDVNPIPGGDDIPGRLHRTDLRRARQPHDQPPGGVRSDVDHRRRGQRVIRLDRLRRSRRRQLVRIIDHRSGARERRIRTEWGIPVYAGARLSRDGRVHLRRLRRTENSAFATATIEVAAVNDPPSCLPVALSTRPGQAISGTLACTDADGDVLTYTKLTDIRGSTGRGAERWIHLRPEQEPRGHGGPDLSGHRRRCCSRRLDQLHDPRQHCAGLRGATHLGSDESAHHGDDDLHGYRR